MSDDGEARRKKLVKRLYELRAEGVARCFWHTFNNGVQWCPRPAVKAHSVQNHGALDLLVENGHVIAPTLRLDAAAGPQIDLKATGRNQATTFAGLCGLHDEDLFSPVEKGQIDLADPEHRFLLGYRATFYELHAAATSAMLVQGGYEKRIELGMDSRTHGLSPAGEFATNRLLAFHKTWAYKSTWDIAYLERNFAAIGHHVVELDVAEPTLAATAMFSVGMDRNNDYICVCLTIVPVSQTRTVALFSHLPAHARRVRRALYGVLRSSGDQQKLEISRHLLNRCWNFVLAPRFVASWAPARRERILDLFIHSMMDHDFSALHPDLNLFV